MKAFKYISFVLVILAALGFAWISLLYRTYGKETLIFLFKSPPEFFLTYSKNMFAPAPTPVGSVETPSEALMIPRPTSAGSTDEPASTTIAVPASHMIKTMSHTYQKLNNCGPSSASMAASTLGVVFDQFVAADVLKGSGSDKNVAADEIVTFLESRGLRALYRVNGTALQVEQLVSQDIPVIAEQWLVKRGGELTGHFRVVRGYDRSRQLFTTNDSFNGPNFVIPYAQFDEWWRPFNRGYVVVYKPEQEAIVQAILGADWEEQSNWQQAVQKFQAESESIGDGYAYFNLGTNLTYIGNYELAVRAYDRALATTFPEHFLWYQFGPLHAYVEQGQYDKVFQLTDRLFAQAGEVEEGRYYRGQAYVKQGKTAEAKSEFEKSLAANPRYAPAIKALEAL